MKLHSEFFQYPKIHHFAPLPPSLLSLSLVIFSLCVAGKAYLSQTPSQRSQLLTGEEGGPEEDDSQKAGLFSVNSIPDTESWAATWDCTAVSMRILVNMYRKYSECPPPFPHTLHLVYYIYNLFFNLFAFRSQRAFIVIV
jgi:hypothetical protein